MASLNLNTVLADVTYGLGLLSSFGQKVDVVGIYANGTGNDGGASGALGSGILNSVLGNTSAVASFGQVFVNARPMKATVRETSKVMEHPVETGAVLADHHVINPVEIEIPLVVNSQYYAATYAQLRTAFLNATLLSVKTRVGVFSNMIIADMPHEEDPEMYDAITIGLRLRQVIYIIPGTTAPVQNYQPLDPLDSDTVAGGIQQAVALGSKLLTGASGIASYANAAKFL